MSLRSCADHRLSDGRLITVQTLNTPRAVPTKCSPVFMMKPSQTPRSHLSSKSPILCCVLGILNRTVSAKGTIFALLLLPFMSWYAVRPFSRTRHFVMRCAACRIIQGTTGCSKSIFSLILDSTSERRVLTRPLKSWMHRSIFPLEFESPTLEFSNAVPYPDLAFATLLWTSMMEGSWSAFMMMRSLVMPTVSMSSRICSVVQVSLAPLDSTAYAHTLWHRVSSMTMVVKLDLAVVETSWSVALPVRPSWKKQ